MTIRFLALTALAACASPTRTVSHDAATSTIPKNAAGIFQVTSTFQLSDVPPAAAPVLAELAAATDDPDDPGRYLVERMIDAIPDARVQAYARDLEPVLAAYVQHELSNIAPNLAPGLGAIAHGLERDARELGTHELWRIELGGALTRAITGIQLGDTTIALSDTSLPDPVATTHATLGPDGTLSLPEHQITFAYGAVLRLALDRAVIPKVVPNATNLADALARLVDCKQLGARVASSVGLGSDALYAAACDVALAQIADRFYATLSAIDAQPATFDARGSAIAIDKDGDGTMDSFVGGSWAGSLDAANGHQPLAAGVFEGQK